MTKDQKRLFLYNNIHFLTQLQEKINLEFLKSFISSDGDPFISRKRIFIHISRELDSILFFIKH